MSSRWRRYLLLAWIVAATLAGLVAVARAGAQDVARERARRWRDLLQEQFTAFSEHAVHLAALEGRAGAPNEVGSLSGEISRHMTRFAGIARVRVFTARGAPVLHVERLGDMVATMPPARMKPGASIVPPFPAGQVMLRGMERDDDRLDRRPDRRRVVRYLAWRIDGAYIELTVYAEPFLAPLRAQGARLFGAATKSVDGHALAHDERFAIGVPVDARPHATVLALGGAVLLLAFGLILISERQLRGQERERLARQLAQMDKLQSLGLLAAGVAHEINNPLEGIANWLRLGNVEKAQEGFDRIRAIVQDLLRFSRPDEPGGAADVEASCQRALELAGYAESFRGTRVHIDVQVGLRVCTSALTLEQVVLNLLLNAGAVSPTIGVSARAVGTRAHIDVVDDGPGIASDDLDRVFDPFFSKSDGTGLGLSVSYGLVGASGGDLRVRNEPGRGARFTVELPLA